MRTRYQFPRTGAFNFFAQLRAAGHRQISPTCDQREYRAEIQREDRWELYSVGDTHIALYLTPAQAALRGGVNA